MLGITGFSCPAPVQGLAGPSPTTIRYYFFGRYEQLLLAVAGVGNLYGGHAAADLPRQGFKRGSIRPLGLDGVRCAARICALASYS